MDKVESELVAATSRSVELYNNGDLPGAIAVWDAVVHANPTSTQAIFARASLQVLVPELQADALNDFVSIARDAEDASLAISAGSQCEQAGLFDAAIKLYGIGIEAQPKNANGYYYRGLAYSHAGFPQLSADDFTSALEINESDGFAYLRRAVSNSEMGKMEDAFSDMNSSTRFQECFAAQHEIMQLYNQTHLAFSIRFADRDLEMALSALEVVIPDATDDDIVVIFKILSDHIDNARSRNLAVAVMDKIDRFSEETRSVIKSLATQAGLENAG